MPEDPLATANDDQLPDSPVQQPGGHRRPGLHIPNILHIIHIYHIIHVLYFLHSMHNIDYYDLPVTVYKMGGCLPVNYRLRAQ